MDVARYRDTILVVLGSVLLVSQAAAFWLTGSTDPALVTAGTSMLVSPLILHKDEKRPNGAHS